MNVLLVLLPFWTPMIPPLGIPNPYTLREIYQADQRWKALHTNAVPPLMEFRSEKAYIDECRSIRKLEQVENTLEFSDDFDI